LGGEKEVGRWSKESETVCGCREREERGPRTEKQRGEEIEQDYNRVTLRWGGVLEKDDKGFT